MLCVGGDDQRLPGTLITQTITFATSSARADDRPGHRTRRRAHRHRVPLAVMALADRRGRRRMLIFSAIAGCAFHHGRRALPLNPFGSAAPRSSPAVSPRRWPWSRSSPPRRCRRVLAYAISVLV